VCWMEATDNRSLELMAEAACAAPDPDTPLNIAADALLQRRTGQPSRSSGPHVPANGSINN
jgi:hypothetical protein